MRQQPTNLAAEPPYPDHTTVLISLGHHEYTAHAPTERCKIEEPHKIVDCEEWRD